MEMDERKLRILQAIIDDYILTAVPVGSRTISKKYDMGLSSATIRNEMSDLEELGYLDQPHVSAGRVPSAKAYRLYVDELLKRGRIPSANIDAVREHFQGRVQQMGDVIDHAAQVLSSLTHYTAVVLPPKGREPRIRTLQLVPVSAVRCAGGDRDGQRYCAGHGDPYLGPAGQRCPVCHFPHVDQGAGRIDAGGGRGADSRDQPPDATQ